MIVTPKAFLAEGLQLMQQKSSIDNVVIPIVTKKTTREKRFRAIYGVSSDVCSHVWEIIQIHATTCGKARPAYLLWCLLFMKTYSTEAVLSTIVGVTEKTFRQWVWRLIDAISRVYDKVIIFDNRLILDGRNRWCTMSVDGTDFPINEPTPFSPGWFSHKFKGPGLRYEIALSIVGGDIVHTNGPFPCGWWPDITIFHEGLMQKLAAGEMVEADNGYRGQYDKIRTPVDCCDDDERKRKNRVRARHETVNKRFKQFGILKQLYRHRLGSHQKVFRAIAVLTQLEIDSGDVLFAVDYN